MTRAGYGRARATTRAAPAFLLAKDVQQKANENAGREVAKHAPSMFDLLRDKATTEIDRLEALPAPPAGVFGAVGNPTGVLATAPVTSRR